MRKNRKTSAALLIKASSVHLLTTFKQENSLIVRRKKKLPLLPCTCQTITSILSWRWGRGGSLGFRVFWNHITCSIKNAYSHLHSTIAKSCLRVWPGD